MEKCATRPMWFLHTAPFWMDSLNTTKKATLESVKAVRAIDFSTVEIELREPFNGLVANLNVGIIPRNSPTTFAEMPIGTGPYRLVQFQQDEGAKLEAFPEYFNGPPRIDSRNSGDSRRPLPEFWNCKREAWISFLDRV